MDKKEVSGWLMDLALQVAEIIAEKRPGAAVIIDASGVRFVETAKHIPATERKKT
ncbi:hypothetical protein ACLGL1_04590 [Peptococcus simiae]|uniref:hypothetical protein n=1 Tax=Peptococcus simiae TaxID=1643805 RepID=UPI003980609A